MPSIVIKEDDITLAGSAAASTDVVFVPGFANTNGNYIILTESGLSPEGLTGCVTTQEANAANIHVRPLGQEFENFACNIVDKITWRCVASATDRANETSTSWEEQPAYIAPAPENYPVLCSTLAEFEANFGNSPYQFQIDDTNKADFDISGLFQKGIIARGSKYMYANGDYDRSYIYAKELVRLGLPVIYENITDRGVEELEHSEEYIRQREDPIITINAEKYLATVGTYADIEMSYLYDSTVDKFLAQVEGGRLELTRGEEFEVSGSLVHGDVIRVARISSDPPAFQAAFEASIPLVTVNENTLKAYFKGSETIVTHAEIDVTFQYDASADEWRLLDASESSLVPEDLGIIITGVAIDGDKVSLSAVYSVNYSKRLATVKYFYEHVQDCFTNTEKLRDKGELTVKYITSGAYPTYELIDEGITASMIECAHDRGDAVALIDHADNSERSLKTVEGSGSVFAHLKNTDPGLGKNTDDYTTFAAMFTPWATYNCTSAPKGHAIQLMPASFGYLTSVGVSIVTNANFLAVAGVNRGLPSSIKSLNTVERLSNTIADAYQPRDGRALNAITNIKPYGLTIWGNRTLVGNADGNLKATSFLNVRNMVSDIKKVAYSAAKSLIYEQESDIMWNKFKALLIPTLDRMVNGFGLASYKIIRAYTKYTGEQLAKGEVAAVIRIVPVYAIEDFEITVVMADDGISVQ